VLILGAVWLRVARAPPGDSASGPVVNDEPALI
jgi:hypothetical protein